jgi:hypothetical protein
MSTDLVSPDRQSRGTWSCCLTTGLGLLAVGAVLVFVVRWATQRQTDREIKERWEHQVADLEAGRTTCMIWPELKFLEAFVRDQPEVAAKITQVEFFMGKVSDERFGYVKQFPRLESIYLDEIWEGADSFLGRIAGMESVTNLSLSRTPLSDEGIRAAASFPNLKRLHLDYVAVDTSLEPLRGHKKLETLALKEVPSTKEQFAVIASLPKLRGLEIEQDDPIPESTLLNLQKALPNVKIERTDNGP